MADNLFPPNQLGTPSLVFNPLRSDLDANQYKITDLPAPTAGADAANKAYVDASVGPGGGAANWANNPAVNNVNMNGFGINSATTIVASGDITASGNSLIATAGQVATNTTAIAANTAAIATKAPLASPTFTGAVTVPNPPANTNCAVNQTYVDNAIAGVSAADWSQYPATQSVNLDGNTLNNAGIVNFNAAGDLSAILGLTLNAGGAANISAGLNASLYAAGTVSIGGPINHFTVDGNDITGVDGLGANTVNAASVNATTVSASGNITGNNVAATATIQGTSVVASGTVQGATVACSGTITGNTITSIGAINAASASITGNVAAATVNASGVINGASINATSGNISALNGSINALGSGLGQGVITAASKMETPFINAETVFTNEIQLGDNAGVNELTFISNEPGTHIITAIEEGGTGTPGGVVDTRINPISADLTGSTLNIKAKNGAGATTTMASVDLGGLTPDPLFTQFLSLSSPPGNAYQLQQNQANAAIDFEVNATGSLTVLLPNNVVPGTAFFIKLNQETSAPGTNIFLTPPGVAAGAPPSVNIRPSGGCFAVAMNTVGGDTQYAMSESFAYFNALQDYVPLAGNAATPMTGTLAVSDTTNIEAKNITTALLTPLPSIGYISALGPMQVENGNFLVANGTATEIGLAATANPPVGEVATITYNYAASDNLIFNKRLEAPNMTLGSTDVLPTLNFKDAQTFYVSKQGSDANSGAINAPFLTIGAATAAGLATGSACIIQVGPGVFTENITINSVAGIQIIGAGPQSDRNIEGTVFKGTITVSCTGANNLNNNMVVISSLAITPGRIRDLSTSSHTLIITDCRIEGEGDFDGSAVEVDMTATDGRTIINNCIITQESTTPPTANTALITVNVGWLDMNNTQATVRSIGHVVNVRGTAFVSRMANCQLTSDSASATPSAIMHIQSTSAAPHNIALTSFAYSVATSKTAAAILATRPSAGSITALVVQCLFALAGTLAAGNVIQYGAGTALVLLVADNRSLNTVAAPYASAIQSGTTTLPLGFVGETRVNTINNLSGNLTIAGAGTVSVSQSGSTITITGSGGSGGITEILGGSGISVANGTGPTATITNTGVLSVGVNSTLVNTGTASEPVLGVNTTGTITTQVIDVNRVQASGTGTDYSSFGTYPRISGTYVPPSEPSQLVPLQYVNNIDTGVLSLNTQAGDINLVGAGTVAVDASVPGTITLTGAGYTALNTGTGISITPGLPGEATIGNTGVINVNGFNGDVQIEAGANVVVDDSVPGTLVISATSAVSGVSGTAGQIAVANGTTAPVISLVAAGAGEQTVPYPSSIAVDDYGRVISIAQGEQTTVNTLGGAITLAAGTNMDIQQVGQTLTLNASFTPTPALASINSETGPAITLQAGANTTITTVAPNVIEIASSGGGGGGGITSINGETGSAITITGSGNATVSVPSANTIQVYAPGKVDQIQPGYGVSIDNAEPLYPIINATVAGLQAGSGITISPQQNNEFLISASGGGGGVQSVSIVPGGGLILNDTDPANPILNNGGVISLQAFQADYGNIEIDNTDGFIGITTVADPTPGSVQKIRLGYNALNSISAADGSITLSGTSQSQIIKANPGGTAYADIDMAALYKITRATGVNTTDKLSFADIGGFQNGYAIKGTDAGTEPGLTRNQVDSADADVANTTAVMYDERNYAPTSPFNPASGFTPGPGGAFVSGVQKLIASQTTTLTQTNFPCKYTSKYLGVAGAISFTLSAAQPLVYQIKYKKNGGASTNASGGVYYTSTQSISVPVNAITWTGVGGAQFTVGDTFTWEIYATYTGVSPPSIVGAPTVFSAVFSPLAV